MASIASLATCLLSWSNIFEEQDVGFRMFVGHTVLVNSTGDVTAVFFDSILQTSTGLTYVGRVKIFYWAGPFVDNVWFHVCCDFILGVHKNGFKGVGSFEDGLYTGMSDNSSIFFFEARNI